MITMQEREIIRHALGLSNPDSRCVGYRNRYYAGGATADICRGLVAKGMALEIKDGDPGEISLFKISTEGFLNARKRSERMDKEETAEMRKIDAAIRAARVEA